MDNLPEGWWKAVDELNYKEANLITSGHSNTCGTSLKKPVGVTTILGNQGQDPVNTDPDKASEAYEGLGPTPDLLRQTLEVVSVDNVPVGRKPFKFKKKGRINSKENVEIQRTHRSLFSWINSPLSLPSVNTDNQVEKYDLTGEVNEGRGEEMEIDRPEYEEWVLEWLTGTITEIENNRKYCGILVEEIVHGAVVQGEQKHIMVLVQRMISDAWDELQVNKLWETFMNLDRNVQAGVERRLATLREEETTLLRMGEEQERRDMKIERARTRSLMFKKKAAAMTLRKVLTKMKELTMEDWGMDVVEEVEDMLSEVMEHNGIEVDEQDMVVDRQTSQQEGCQTRPENIISLEVEMEDDIKHPPYTPVPESTQLAGEAWSWRQPESVDRQTNQQEGCQYTPKNITSLEEELDDDIKHPAYTAEPENTQLEQTSRVDQTGKMRIIQNKDYFIRGKVNLDDIPNSNCNSSLVKKQPAKISTDCNWSGKWTNGGRIGWGRKRKGENLTSTKTKKLRLCP